jgi:zinc transport system substrate-binding protein
MKRVLIILAVLLLAVSLSGCSGTGREPEEKISIVCTIFPQYDWIRQIIGEDNMYRFDVTLLIDSRIDLHSYNPSVSDIIAIKESDVFIYVGGHSDNWAEAMLRDADQSVVTMNLMEQLDIGHLLEGFCDENCDEDHDHTFDHDDFQADEHIWLSLRFVKILCAAIADMLSAADPEKAEAYQANATAYIAKLSALDAEYQSAVESANVRTLVFADRFPFRYLLNDYGITHYAAFQGCSAEGEASFVTIISLANRINQLGLNVVMVTETSDQSIARTVINNTADKNQRILVLDGMKAVTSADMINGTTYLSIMEENLEVLREALN